MSPSESNERQWVWLLCLLAAAHVFLYATVFPFFTDVDEEAHFDLAVKYSHAQPPRALTPLSDETMDYYIIYLSQEYMHAPPDGKNFPPPIWRYTASIADPIKAERRKLWNDPNHESAQPPLYYTLAGIWWQAGHLLGFHDGFLLYWLRFLNLPIIVALVWLGYTAARLIFPADKFLRLGVPVLIACFPQPAFYSLQNDMLSAVTFGAAFILLVKLERAERPDMNLAIGLGLTWAATFLTKSSNLPLLAVAAIFIGWKIWRLIRTGKGKSAAPALVTLVACAILPMIAWMAWCQTNFGDLLGSKPKMQYLGWTTKPFAAWWSHPIFTPHGLWTFFSGLLGTFWQGELLWHRQPLASPITGAVYAVLSAVIIILALCHLRLRGPASTEQRHALWFSFWATLSVIVFLGFLSIIYDFHDCFYPSHAHPYFTSGRLMLGALIPFLLLFAYGLDRLLITLKMPQFRPAALAIIVGFMLITEALTDQPVFTSEYNWYHLPNASMQSAPAQPAQPPASPGK